MAAGASAGGLPTLTHLVATLPEDLAAVVLVTVHVGDRPSTLPAILSRVGRLPAVHAQDGEPARAGRIYVAPPGRHLSLRNGAIQLGFGPRLNGHRPSVDAMFAAAANWAGHRAVAVILPGALDDGAVGAALVPLAGGQVLVQDPEEARFPGMPSAALSAVPDATVATTDQLARHVSDAVSRIVHLPRSAAPQEVNPMTMRDSDDPAFLLADETRLTRMACPDCNGGLAEIQLPHVKYYGCHVRHHFAPQSLALAQAQAQAQARTTEAKLWTAVAALEEAAAFARHLAAHPDVAGDQGSAEGYRRSAERATRLARRLHAELGSLSGRPIRRS